MNRVTQQAVQKILALNGLTVEKSTDKELVVSLIEKLHPFRTDKSLIRLGPDGDGGYLVPDDIEGISACFSPGVGKISAFEQDCLKYGMQVFLADKSVDSLPVKNDHFHFIKKYIGPITDGDYIKMDDWVNTSLEDKSSDLLLQMDIEGHEYFSILSMSDTLLSRFRIMVIEFHRIQKLWNKEFFYLASAMFNKILQNHTCIHIHPNNCCGIEKLTGIEIPILAEFTFIRNDRIISKSPQTNFPHPLDFDNTGNKTIILPECWHAHKNA
jgi:hypothetical protein